MVISTERRGELWTSDSRKPVVSRDDGSHEAHGAWSQEGFPDREWRTNIGLRLACVQQSNQRERGRPSDLAQSRSRAWDRRFRPGGMRINIVFRVNVIPGRLPADCQQHQ
ncbi:MAG: PhzA/PhzB family protein [Pseudomonadota bacterium]|uniref:PhzA/PhzB family protein n=1 Tax=Paraburkholderia sp. TaxID=1926495 RepID=UPI0014851521